MGGRAAGDGAARRPRGRGLSVRRALLLLVALLSVSACGGSGDGRTTDGFARLDAATSGFDTSRKAAVASADSVVAAAVALDAADEVAGRGARSAAKPLRVKARAAVPPARAGLGALGAHLRAYSAAVAELRAAAEQADLDDGQRRAVLAVADAGAAEAAVLETFRIVASRSWPAYAELDRDESTWLDRATAGWYRNEKESAGAYVVLTSSNRAALEGARTALADADAARGVVRDRLREAQTRAKAVLAPLMAPTRT